MSCGVLRRRATSDDATNGHAETVTANNGGAERLGATNHVSAMVEWSALHLDPHYYVKDHLGGMHAVQDSNGHIVESYRYDAWGRVLGIYDGNGMPLTQSAIGNRFLWQGREYSWATGLYYFRARWYDPVTGRWLSNDPIGISGGLNQYVFCGNNPVNARDPSGLCKKKSGTAGEEDPYGIGAGKKASKALTGVGVVLLFVPGAEEIGVGVLLGTTWGDVSLGAVESVAEGDATPFLVSGGAALAGSAAGKLSLELAELPDVVVKGVGSKARYAAEASGKYVRTAVGKASRRLDRISEKATSTAIDHE